METTESIIESLEKQEGLKDKQGLVEMLITYGRDIHLL